MHKCLQAVESPGSVAVMWLFFCVRRYFPGFTLVASLAFHLLVFLLRALTNDATAKTKHEFYAAVGDR